MRPLSFGCTAATGRTRRSRAIACFDQALEDVGLARDERLRCVLHDYFAWPTTTTMARYHHSAKDVPDGLPIPKWSWHGLASETKTDGI
jgi:hemoglobin